MNELKSIFYLQDGCSFVVSRPVFSFHGFKEDDTGGCLNSGY